MKQAVLIFSVLVGSILVVNGYSSCQVKNFTVQPDFDLDRYLGKWYEIKWIPQAFLPVSQRYIDYTHTYLYEDSKTVSVSIKARDPVNCIFYNRKLRLTDVPGKFEIYGDADSPRPYWVMATDYGFSVVYGCREVNVTTGECEANKADAWIWSRQTYLWPEAIRTAERMVEDLCLNISDFYDTAQSGIECIPGASWASTTSVLSLAGIMTIALLVLWNDYII